MTGRPTGKERKGTARRQRARHQIGRITEHLAGGNIVVQVRDARAPALTDPSRLVSMPPDRIQCLVLTKSDLADPATTSRWVAHFRGQGFRVRAVDQSDPRRAAAQLVELMEEARAHLPGKRKQGMAVVVGLPNVGKSTLINRVVGRKAMPAADRPGVTKGETWCRITPDLMLLDTPGVIESMGRVMRDAGDDGFALALLRLAPASLWDPVDVAAEALATLGPKLTRPPGASGLGSGEDQLRELAILWNRRVRGGEPDLVATAGRLLRELSEGGWGRFSLEDPAGPRLGETSSGGEPAAPPGGAP